MRYDISHTDHQVRCATVITGSSSEPTAESHQRTTTYYVNLKFWSSDRSTMRSTEKSIVGTLFLLFGITWLAYANTQPIVYETGSICSTGWPATNIPPCTHLSYTATLFYIMGIVAVVFGSSFLLWRLSSSFSAQADEERKRPTATVSES